MRSRKIGLVGILLLISGCSGSSQPPSTDHKSDRPADVPRTDISKPISDMSNTDLIQALGHVDHDKQRTAELALIDQGPKIVPELIAALDDPNWHVRAGVIRTLGLLGTDASDALPHLKEIAENDESEAVRDAASFNIPPIEGGENNLWQVK